MRKKYQFLLLPPVLYSAPSSGRRLKKSSEFEKGKENAKKNDKADRSISWNPSDHQSFKGQWAALDCAPSLAISDSAVASVAKVLWIQTASSGRSSTRRSAQFSIGFAPLSGPRTFSPPPRSHSTVSSLNFAFPSVQYWNWLGILLLAGILGNGGNFSW